MADDKIDPMGLLYEDFAEIVNNITIKYSGKAEEYETLETQQNADLYLDVINGKDNFFTYIDYTLHDYLNSGWNDLDTINTVLETKNTDLVPKQYRSYLLETRRQRVLDNFEEKNNYYRMLNGYPDVEDTEYYYPPEELVEKYDLPKNVPYHLIEDYCNKIVDGQGSYYMALIEGEGYIDELIKLHPDKEYLKFIGTYRISIKTAREALNFQCIQLKKGDIAQSVYEEFLYKYEQCREYFVKVIYTKEYKSFLDYYDNFIAMCIMVMTVQQMNVGQLKSSINRDYFSIYGIRSLYQAYNVPYNLDIDEYTQNELVQNLNLLIQDKATNKVIYNLAYLLGFTNINIYKYYLGKERKFDLYGAPIVAYKEKFNTDTGEVETVPDYETMYDLYFQKEELRNTDFTTAFNNKNNSVDYDEIVENDAFWWTDDKLYKRIWETEYNFIESKYLGIGVAYSMTNLLFENVLLLKMLMAKNEMTKTIFVELPKITGSAKISIFDLVIYLITLMASKHNLTGEIITIPTQVTSVVDYMRNVEETDMLVDTLSFDFSYFDPANIEARGEMEELKKMLGTDAYNKFMVWAEDLAYSVYAPTSSKIKKINSMFSDAKSIYRFLNFYMTKVTDKETYDKLKTMSNTIFYSKEMRDIFTIEGEYSGQKRTAWTYYEYLYHKDHALYDTFFEIDLDQLWKDYLVIHSLKPEEFTYEQYLTEIELGNIKVDYGQVKHEYEDIKDETLYYYINHIIDRLTHVVSKLDLVYLINNSSTSLSTLLMELIKFFKSYTVDLISFETTFILDFKPGNTVKLMDEMSRIIKTIAKDDDLKLSHSDVLHKVHSTMNILDKLSLEDKLLYTSILTLYDKDLVTMHDVIVKTFETEHIDDDYFKRIFDATHIESTTPIKESGLTLKDSISIKVDEK